MSIKLNLYVRRLPDIELMNEEFRLTRLFCDVVFEFETSLSDPYSGIIDTGAPISIIPFSIWSRTTVRKLKKVHLQGITAGKECAVPVTAGIMSAIFVGKEGNRVKRSFRTYLAENDEVPLLLGMQDLLEKTEVFLDLKKEMAWIEF